MNMLIFVIGLSGSGKSTYSRHICEQYNIKYISLDELSKNDIDIVEYVIDCNSICLIDGLQSIDLFFYSKTYRELIYKSIIIIMNTNYFKCLYNGYKRDKHKCNKGYIYLFRHYILNNFKLLIKLSFIKVIFWSFNG